MIDTGSPLHFYYCPHTFLWMFDTKLVYARTSGEKHHYPVCAKAIPDYAERVSDLL
jgi:hypothetical protein